MKIEALITSDESSHTANSEGTQPCSAADGSDSDMEFIEASNKEVVVTGKHSLRGDVIASSAKRRKPINPTFVWCHRPEHDFQTKNRPHVDTQEYAALIAYKFRSDHPEIRVFYIITNNMHSIKISRKELI